MTFHFRIIMVLRRICVTALSRYWIFLYNGWTPPAVTGMLPQTRPPFYLNRIEWGQRTVIVNVIGGRMRNEPSPGRLPGP